MNLGMLQNGFSDRPTCSVGFRSEKIANCSTLEIPSQISSGITDHKSKLVVSNIMGNTCINKAPYTAMAVFSYLTTYENIKFLTTMYHNSSPTSSEVQTFGHDLLEAAVPARSGGACTTTSSCPR